MIADGEHCVLCEDVLETDRRARRAAPCKTCGEDGGYTNACAPCAVAWWSHFDKPRCSLCLTEAERAEWGLVQ